MILNLEVAAGIGLLIGVERERRKCEGPSGSFAGLRTFAVTSLAGATNTASKILFATASGRRAFALRVIPGLIAAAVMAWAGAWYAFVSG